MMRSILALLLFVDGLMTKQIDNDLRCLGKPDGSVLKYAKCSPKFLYCHQNVSVELTCPYPYVFKDEACTSLESCVSSKSGYMRADNSGQSSLPAKCENESNFNNCFKSIFGGISALLSTNPKICVRATSAWDCLTSCGMTIPSINCMPIFKQPKGIELGEVEEAVYNMGTKFCAESIVLSQNSEISKKCEGITRFYECMTSALKTRSPMHFKATMERLHSEICYVAIMFRIFRKAAPKSFEAGLPDTCSSLVFGSLCDDVNAKKDEKKN